ncbi:MAG: metallophosphatase family protein [Lentimicrobiaceae bacterium]|nr:metallophosphatase family protein [Lentimicrobiaceae bacterium]
MKIGVLSDTHSFLHPQSADFFAPCGQIWHAGDIGSTAVLETLKQWKPVRAVYGNIDGGDIRKELEEHLLFEAEQAKVLLLHIGGRPPKYNTNSKLLIERYKPTIFVCGHSHILSVRYDKTHNLLYINPGAAGNYGFHKAVTFLRFDIKQGVPSNLEVFHQDRQ